MVGGRARAAAIARACAHQVHVGEATGVEREQRRARGWHEALGLLRNRKPGRYLGAKGAAQSALRNGSGPRETFHSQD